MKVCGRCGEEIGGRDGVDNLCEACDRAAANGKRCRTRMSRKAREEVLRSCGMVKVRGALGGTYWE